MTLRPLIFSATLAASLLACRLRASSSAFMPSNLARLSAVARKALPRLSRKLRANPSLTRTTSPIWPSLATRSSKMTSMFVLLLRYSELGGLAKRSGCGKRRRSRSQIAPAQPEERVGYAEKRDRQDGPREHQDNDVGTAKPGYAVLQRQRQRMQHRKTRERVSKHQRRGEDLCHHRRQP